MATSQNSQNYNLLMKDINKCLDDWRGKPPPADVFHPPDHIPCYLCIESREKNPHEFSRVSVEAQLKEWQASYLKNSIDKGNLSSGIHQIASADSFRTLAFLDSTSEQKCILRCEVLTSLFFRLISVAIPTTSIIRSIAVVRVEG